MLTFYRIPHLKVDKVILLGLGEKKGQIVLIFYGAYFQEILVSSKMNK